MKNILSIVAIAMSAVALVIGLGLMASVGDNTNQDLGSTRYPHGVDVTSSGDYKVDGTTVIDASGNVDAPITSTTGTFSGAVAISNTLVTDELTDGGGCYATSTSNTSETLVEADLLNYNCLEFLPNTGATTYTLPATSTLTSLLPSVGDHRTWLFENATSSSGITATFAAGTGIDLIGVTANDDVIDETEYSQFECWRKTDTDVTCVISELLAAD